MSQADSTIRDGLGVRLGTTKTNTTYKEYERLEEKIKTLLDQSETGIVYSGSVHSHAFIATLVLIPEFVESQIGCASYGVVSLIYCTARCGVHYRLTVIPRHPRNWIALRRVARERQRIIFARL